MERIVRVHHPDLDQALVTAAIDRFYALRRTQGLRKPPSTSELVDWLGVLAASGLDPDRVRSDDPYLGVLLKQEADHALLGRRRTR
jgi:MoxR-like ATPase